MSDKDGSNEDDFDFDEDERDKERQETAKVEPVLAVKETKAVSTLRKIVLMVLVLTAAVVSILVYWYTHATEVDDFETAATAHATKIIQSFHENVMNRLGAINGQSMHMTTMALATNQSFPVVTVPYFEIGGADTRILADSVDLWYCPLVTSSTRADWEAYALQNYDHMYQSFGSEKVQKTAEDARYNYTTTTPLSRYLLQDLNIVRDRLLQSEGNGNNTSDAEFAAFQAQAAAKITEDGYSPVMVGTFGFRPYQDNQIYAPVWQISPVVPQPGVLNYDLLTHPAGAEAYYTTLTTGQALIGEASDLFDSNDDGETADFFSALLAAGQYRHDIAAYVGDPISSLVYPVFDTFDPTNRQVAGMVIMTIYWRLYFTDSLPDDTRGLIVVLENTLNQTFSYRIDGRDATYLGVGDFHDDCYDDLGRTQDVTDYIATRGSPTTRAFTAVDLNEDYCRWTMHVYPSKSMEDDYVTNKPILYTVVVAFIFLFTSAVFLLYDYLVERRQSIVMDNATKSGALVSSLFPLTVRDRLYETNHDDTTTHRKGDDFDMVCQIDDTYKQGFQYGGRPIAEKHPEASVLFADLASFTQWSSSREPEDVFHLLETIYTAFDRIATKRNVYKIETIGDCYVAVTGIPNAQTHHAVILVKFAREILLKMGLLRTMLAEQLGADTLGLDLRIGIQSGPVTSGVLRGERSRFQIFGDTVNTAARLETLGRPGRIHVGEAVAKELMGKGKAHWLVRREDTVLAKGKGEMQTHWVKNDGGEGGGEGSVTTTSMTADNALFDSPKYTGKHVTEEEEEEEDVDWKAIESKLRARTGVLRETTC